MTSTPEQMRYRQTKNAGLPQNWMDNFFPLIDTRNADKIKAKLLLQATSTKKEKKIKIG